MSRSACGDELTVAEGQSMTIASACPTILELERRAKNSSVCLPFKELGSRSKNLLAAQLSKFVQGAQEQNSELS